MCCFTLYRGQDEDLDSYSVAFASFISKLWLTGAALGRVPVNPWISRSCTKGLLKFKIKCDSLEVVKPWI